MKKLIYIFAFLFLASRISFSQPEIGQAEIIIRDSAITGGANRMFVKVYPVGTVFSGYYINTGFEHRFSFPSPQSHSAP